ncbi:hypothetical protein FKM82_026403, partial [Ascaphus truei]
AFAKMASAPASYGIGATKSKGLLSRVMNTGSQFVMEGVKNLVLKQQVNSLRIMRALANVSPTVPACRLLTCSCRRAPGVEPGR